MEPHSDVETVETGADPTGAMPLEHRPGALQWLVGTDALFVSLKRPAWSQCIAIVVAIDGAAPGFGGFDAVRAIAEQRLATVPKLRWKLKETPFGLGRPVWVNDRAFDVAHHVRRVAVPAPGGRREVGRAVGELMSRTLERRFPLWEVVYVDGISSGTVVVVAKFHHSVTDGRGLANFVSSLFGDAPDARSRAVVVTSDEPKDPSSLELVGRGVVSTLGTPVRVVRYASGLAGRASAAVAAARDPDTAPLLTPRSPFNGAVGPRRELAFASVALADILATKNALNVTINDVVLATVAGALRSYLEAMAERTDRPLVASVPMSTADAEAADSLNEVVNMWVALPTNHASPLERVHLTRRAANAAKQFTATVRRSAVESVGTVLPPAVLKGAARLIDATHAGGLGPAFGGNLVVSNIRGPATTRYANGARVVAVYPGSIVTVNLGLNVTLMSYADRIDFGFTVDPDIVTDPWMLADRLPPALAELMDATGLGAPTQVADPFTTAAATDARSTTWSG